MNTQPRTRRIAALSGALLLFVCVMFFLFHDAGEIRSQRLSDGSVLVLTQVAYGKTNVLTSGNAVERLLGGLIPAKGIHAWGISLHRPERMTHSYEGKPYLLLEFRLSSLSSSGLAISKVPGEIIYSVSDEQGHEFTEPWLGFIPGRIGQPYHSLVTKFPRDAKWLNIGISQLKQSGDPMKIAAFRIRNPAPLVKQPWLGSSLPICIATNGMDFALAEATVEERMPTIGYWYRQRTFLPVRVRKNGGVLTNWAPVSLDAEDATGNHCHLSPMWLVLQTYIRTNWQYPGVLPNPPEDWSVHWSWEPLDSRFVWRLETDFAPLPAAPSEDRLEFVVPDPSASFTTNLAGVPVHIRCWEPRWQLPKEFDLEADIPTNRTDLRIAILGLRDDKGDNVDYGLYPEQTHTRLINFSRSSGTSPRPPLHATIAVVPNVHVTFYIQPRLVRQEDNPK